MTNRQIYFYQQGSLGLWQRIPPYVLSSRHLICPSLVLALVGPGIIIGNIFLNLLNQILPPPRYPGALLGDCLTPEMMILYQTPQKILISDCLQILKNLSIKNINFQTNLCHVLTPSQLSTEVSKVTHPVWSSPNPKLL